TALIGAVAFIKARFLRLNCLAELADIYEMSGDCSGCSHCWGHQMGAALEALAPLEVAVRGRSATLARLQAIVVHRKAHRAARFTPVKARRNEDLVQPFRFSLRFHEARTWNDHCLNALIDLPAFGNLCRGAEIFAAATGAGTDDHHGQSEVADLRASRQAHGSQR